jgi:hypothetical protein
MLFVPQSQVEEVQALRRDLPETGLDVRGLPEEERSPRAALRDYLDELRVPPGPDRPRAARREYYLSCAHEMRARKYYRTTLLPDIITELRAQWERQAGPAAASHLVTVASDSPELAAMAVAVVRPRRCLLLSTRDKAAKADEALELIREHAAGCEVVPHPFPDLAAMLADLAEPVRAFTAGCPPEEVVLDLTPGTKEISLALAFEAARAGNRLSYVRHDRRDARVVPFSERLMVRTAGAPSRSGAPA